MKNKNGTALVVTTAHKGVFFGYGTPGDARKYDGERLWVVALHEPVQERDDKLGSLKRTFLCGSRVCVPMNRASAYLEFLRRKVPRAEMCGFEPPSECHASLKPHQRRKQSRAISAGCAETVAGRNGGQRRANRYDIM